MHGDGHADMMAALRSMSNVALQRNKYDRIAARETMRGFLEHDRRFDPYDKQTLIRRVEECQYSGAKLNLDDPRLKGEPERPLERSYWQY